MGKTLILIFLVLTFHSCSKLEIDITVPGCIKAKIASFIPTICDADANISEYILQAQVIYVFSRGFCGPDTAAEVYDSSCNRIGFMGGFAGSNKIKGIEFSSASFVRIIWRYK